MATFSEAMAALQLLKNERDTYQTSIISCRKQINAPKDQLTQVALASHLKSLNDRIAFLTKQLSGDAVPGAGGTIVNGGFPNRRSPDPKVWELWFEDDFPALASEGQFLKQYGKWLAYPSNYITTSKKGYYEPNNISVIDTPDGQRAMQCRLVPGSMNKDGKPSGCAPYPAMVRGVDMAWEQEFMILDADDDWHMANLTWPISERWPFDGENDFAEMNLGGTLGAFFHHYRATSGGDQTHFSTNIRPDTWVRVGFEVIGGQYMKWFVNGQQVGPTVPADKVPTVDHRIVLQLEDNDGKPTKVARVLYNYVTAWKRRA